MLAPAVRHPLISLVVLQFAAAYDYANQEALYPNDFEGAEYVENFHQIPRLQGGNDFNEDENYYIGVGMMVVPWFLVGLLLFVFVPCYMCCCKKTQGASILKMIPCLLIVGGCAVGWTGVGHTLAGSNEIGDELKLVSETLLQCDEDMSSVETNLNTMDAALSTIVSTTCPSLSSDLADAQDAVTSSLSEVDNYKSIAQGNAESVSDLSDLITGNTDSVGQAMLGVLMLFAAVSILALLVLWRTKCIEKSGKDIKDVCCMGCCRRIFFWFAFIIMFICFILSGVLMGVAALAADFCAKPGANLLEIINPATDGDFWNLTYYYTNDQCAASTAGGDYGMLANSIFQAKDDMISGKSEVDLINNMTLLNYTCSSSAVQTSAELTSISNSMTNIGVEMDDAATVVGCSTIYGHYHSFIIALCGENAVVLGLIFIFIATFITAVFLFVLLVTVPSQSSAKPPDAQQAPGDGNAQNPNSLGAPGQVELAAVGIPAQPVMVVKAIDV